MLSIATVYRSGQFSKEAAVGVLPSWANSMAHLIVLDFYIPVCVCAALTSHFVFIDICCFDRMPRLGLLTVLSEITCVNILWWRLFLDPVCIMAFTCGYAIKLKFFVLFTSDTFIISLVDWNWFVGLLIKLCKTSSEECLYQDLVSMLWGGLL